MRNADYVALSKRFHRGLRNMKDQDLHFMSDPKMYGTRILYLNGEGNPHLARAPTEREKLVSTLMGIKDYLANEIPGVIDRLEQADATKASSLCGHLEEIADSLFADKPVGNRELIQSKLDGLLRIIDVLSTQITDKRDREWQRWRSRSTR